MVESGKFSVFDLIKLVDDNINPESKLDSETFDITTLFKQLMQKLDKELKGKQDKAMLVIDDASILELTGGRDTSLFKLIYDLNKYKENLNLIMYSQVFAANEDSLIDLAFLADLYVQIENLSTGYSKDIQGQVFYLFLLRESILFPFIYF